MPVIQREVAVLTTATDDNLLSGSAFEFAQRNQLLSIGCLASQAGGFITIQSGSDIVLEESPAAVNATAFPTIPDEMYYTDVAAVGDRLVIRARNTAGTTTTFRLIVQVTPI